MQSKIRLGAAATAVITLLLAVTGCGSSAKTATTGSPASPPQKIVADAYKYSSCMRDNGVSGFPDPKAVNQPGQHGLSIQITPAITSSPAFAKARNACSGIMPGGQFHDGSPAQQAQQQETRKEDALSFADCMRAKGVANFPDPDAQGQLTVQMVVAQGIDVHAASVLSAVKACLPASHGALTVAGVRQAIASVP
jgi:hypothetical protein